MAKRNYIIYCDESDKRGPYFSNFFGGVILRDRDREAIEFLLQEKKAELNLNNEIKWERLSKNYLNKYKEFITFYFKFIKTGRLKVRIMFTQNRNVPSNLTKRQMDNEYFLLYYQFIKHGFGIKYCNPNALDRVYFSIFPDQIPENSEKITAFKASISNISNTPDMRGSQVFFPLDRIVDVDSKKHTILQGLDIILGAMCSKLNNKFLNKEEGKRVRGKRTIAKEKLYKHINKEIRDIYPNFNVGASTAIHGGEADRWEHPYRHWLFKPKNHIVDKSAKMVKPR